MNETAAQKAERLARMAAYEARYGKVVVTYGRRKPVGEEKKRIEYERKFWGRPNSRGVR